MIFGVLPDIVSSYKEGSRELPSFFIYSSVFLFTYHISPLQKWLKP